MWCKVLCKCAEWIITVVIIRFQSSTAEETDCFQYSVNVQSFRYLSIIISCYSVGSPAKKGWEPLKRPMQGSAQRRTWPCGSERLPRLTHACTKPGAQRGPGTKWGMLSACEFRSVPSLFPPRSLVILSRSLLSWPYSFATLRERGIEWERQRKTSKRVKRWLKWHTGRNVWGRVRNKEVEWEK